MSGLTRKQQQILDFIQKWQRTEGATPTFREIADQFGFRSLNSVTELMIQGVFKALIRKALG